MRCEEVQDLASAWLDDELSESRARAVSDHEAHCEDCHGLITDMRLMTIRVKGLGQEPAPPGLEERIRITLAEEYGAEEYGADKYGPRDPVDERPGAVVLGLPRPANRFGWRGFVQQAASMAAVCLLSVFGTWAVVHQPEGASTARHDVVAAHVRSLLQDSPIQVPSSDTHTVRPWFNGRVEFVPPVKDLGAEGFTLVGGRLDYVDGHRVATIVYRRRLHTISVFVWPETSAQTGARAQVEGLNVLSWTKDGMVWWAVSDLDSAELRELRALL
jgi:anti-sigma factor RsiW